ncbi:MAG: hypothetical protein J6B71_06485 [Clostridia bacterium]|nr:hypothetical protein [Clostridia bacterium]
MKKIIKLFLMTVLLGLAIVTLSACADWELPYVDADAEGYTVSVRFDANGGMFAGTNNVYVVDVFNPATAKKNAEGKAEIALIAPDDSRRENNAFEVSNTGYFLAGWYQERTLRTDENGNALDADGNLCSASGKPQGYVYGGRWDFETDRLTVDPNKTYSSQENVLTLYAAWVPYYTYEFYALNATTGQFELYSTQQMMELTLPEWNQSTGKIDMKRFPDLNGKTFDKAYTDATMTEELTGKIGGSIDYEKGIANAESIKVYTTWLEGDWFKIYTAKQFYDNSRLGGNYILCADLDFSNQVWAPTLAKGEFKGTILGNGHKISNVKVTQSDSRQEAGGLFGKLHASAKIENVTFENLTYIVTGSISPNGASFGLLAGTIADGAALTDVQISGALQIDAAKLIDEFGLDIYDIGLLCGEGKYGEISTDGITCTLTNNDANKFALTVNDDKTVTLTATTNGTN